MEESVKITKDELRASGFEALDQDDPEGWWLRCPPFVMVTILDGDYGVRYCFDYPDFSLHEDDYYEYGKEAVEIAQEKYFKKGQK
jgi:hypothetical protein